MEEKAEIKPSSLTLAVSTIPPEIATTRAITPPYVAALPLRYVRRVHSRRANRKQLAGSAKIRVCCQSSAPDAARLSYRSSDGRSQSRVIARAASLKH